MRSFDSITAAELFSSNRRQIVRPGPFFIDAIDTHTSKTLPASTWVDSTLKWGDVIEVQGASASGKTSLLYFLVMTTILPYSITMFRGNEDFEVILGGREKAVIVCDCDESWDAPRLRHLLSEHVMRRLLVVMTDVAESDASRLFESSIKTIVDHSLKRLHIFRPTSPLTLLATLISLPIYHSSSMPDQEICMLMIDSLTSFHWPDLWRPERAYAHDDGDEIRLGRLVTTINDLRARMNIITFIANWIPTSPPDPSTKEDGLPIPPLCKTLMPTFNLAPSNYGHPGSFPGSSFSYQSSLKDRDRNEPLRPIAFVSHLIPNLPLAHQITLTQQSRHNSDNDADRGSPSSHAPSGSKSILGTIRTPVLHDADLAVHIPPLDPLDPSIPTIGPIPKPQPIIRDGQFEFTIGPHGIDWSASREDSLAGDEAAAL
ncbi:hypothetical protein DL93DRAFT_2228268 [Clavulina sp. PMI_390]|nr:hypothetical protein DL93DRAFT_2228268 [Clavulina sp. PMI_390]